MIRYGCFLLILILLSCSNQHGTTEQDPTHLGTIDHAFSISEEAKGYFDEGLLLLHSFEYADANEAFKKAQLADDQEIMVYWGLAMTHYKALWGLQDVAAGRAVIQEWEQSRDETTEVTSLEASFWEAVEILYGKGELKERNESYVRHMKTLYEEYPGNLEVAAFYSLGLMWADYDSEANLKLSSKVAAGIIEENPTHPGALHYMIHANDDPDYAGFAIDAANAYAKVAPDAAHALHMPSHIYVALGMWNEVVTSNQDSYAASLQRVEEKKLHGSKRGYHSMAWLHYGYLQQGNYEKAADLLKEMIDYYQAGEGSDSYLINMQNQQRIESGYWPEELEFQLVDYNGLGLDSKSAMHFSKSLLAFDAGDVEAIQAEIVSLKQVIAAAELIVGENGIALCSAGPTRYAPTPTAINKTKVVIHQMNALVAMLSDEGEVVDRELKSATLLELESGYDPGPPFIAYPSFEMYGEWLMLQDRYEEALNQFEVSVERRTNRTKGLKGKIEALRALDRFEEVQEIEAILNQFS